jgi:hypothetical protein
VPLLVYANAKTRRVNKIQIKQDSCRNKSEQSGENKCSGKETFKLGLRFLDKKYNLRRVADTIGGQRRDMEP